MLINTILAAMLTTVTAIVRVPAPEIPKLMPPPPPEHWSPAVEGAAP
jgi:hypothetical protein